MSTEHAFQIGVIAVNAISGLAWFAIRAEIKHVRELLSQRLDALEARVEKLEV